MGTFNGSGTFVRSFNWQQDAANGINITASRFDTEDDGFASGLSNCITRDGQGVPTAATPWGGQNLTGVGNLTAATGTFSGNLSVGGTFTITGGLGNASTVLDGAGIARTIGYRGIPLTAKTTAYTIALTDVGQGISTTAGVTIPPNSSVAFAIGDTVAIYNNSTASITITQGAGVTIRLGGSATTGNRTLAQRGLVVMLKVGTDEWVALNGGVS